MVNSPKKQNISIQQILTALLDDNTVFPPAYLRRFSDLEDPDLAALKSVWPQVSPNRRYNLLEDLEYIAETDTLVVYDNVAKMALSDEDPRVRTVAIRLLWETVDTKLVKVFIKIMTQDESIDVRAAAATALGWFVYLGEIEEISTTILHQVEEALLRTVSSNEEILVRRRALESLGFSGRKEVPLLIRKAYESDQPDWLISALFAIGRSVDSSWEPEVVKMLNHPQTNVQMEAVRAAGELELESTSRIMFKMLDDELYDTEMRGSIYWSLSKIGGAEVRETLESRLEETEDEDEIIILEEAIENLDFTDELGLLDLMEIDDLPDVEESPEEFLARRDVRTIDLENPDVEINDDIDDVDDEISTDEDDSPNKPSPEAKKKRHRH